MLCTYFTIVNFFPLQDIQLWITSVPPRVGLASDLLTPQSQELRRLLRVVSLRAQRFPDGLGGQNRTDVWAFCPYALRLWLTSA
jgi:hypothetical protein